MYSELLSGTHIYIYPFLFPRFNQGFPSSSAHRENSYDTVATAKTYHISNFQTTVRNLCFEESFPGWAVCGPQRSCSQWCSSHESGITSHPFLFSRFNQGVPSSSAHRENSYDTVATAKTYHISNFQTTVRNLCFEESFPPLSSCTASQK